MNRLRLSADRMQFLDGGAPFRWKGTLTWPLYGRALTLGLPNAMSVVDDRKAVGANTICCALMLSWGFPFSPSTPGYWETLNPFVSGCYERGMRICFVVFCDTRTLMPDAASQHAHWDRICAHLAPWDNVTLVLANQAGHPTQTIDIATFAKPTSLGGHPAMLACIDNPMEDAMPTEPFWDFCAFDAKRNDPNWWDESGGFSMATAVLIGANGKPPSRRATLMFEPPACGRPGHDEWTDAGKWRQFARSLCFDGTAGGNFYSDFDARADIYPPGVVRNSAIEFLGNVAPA